MTSRYARRVAGYLQSLQDNKGEVFPFMDEIERLIKWYRVHKPSCQTITLPREWKGIAVIDLLPKFAHLESDGITWKWQGFILKPPPELSRAMRRIAPKK